MARIRTIKPEFHDDEKMATIPRDARLLFIAMWNFSDDYGVIKGHPTWIKNKVFPYDEIKQSVFNEWLIALEKLRCIIPFDTNGEKFYYIRTFQDHQRVDKPSQMRNPEPPDDILETNRSLFDEGSTSIPGGLPVVREGKVSSKGREGSTYSDEFQKFWDVYPKKVAKQEAWKAWKKRNGTRPNIVDIIKAIEIQRQSDQWTRESGQFIPNPSTWINQGRWDDEVEKKEQSRWFK